MMLLLMFYSYPPKVMVGTDIVHAVILTGVTSFLHFRLGNVDPSLVAYLLIGSIPGGILGSHLSTRVPVLWLRRILCAILLTTGIRMVNKLVFLLGSPVVSCAKPHLDRV